MNYELANEVFAYDAEVGGLRWKIRPSNIARIGQMVGSNDGAGYIQFRFRGKRYRVHQIVWLLNKKRLASMMIDHIDGDRSNNKIENLREVSPTQNAQNRRAASRDSKSGLLGVSPYRRKWAAQIMANGKAHRLGIFNSSHEAKLAYDYAKARLHVIE